MPASPIRPSSTTCTSELTSLVDARDRALPSLPDLEPMIAELKAVNEALWEIEDEIRICEKRGDLGPRFIALARSVYRQNDRRVALKRTINERLGSKIIEEKAFASELTPSGFRPLSSTFAVFDLRNVPHFGCDLNSFDYKGLRQVAPMDKRLNHAGSPMGRTT